ncbi:MAG: ubiquinol-cytochrome c reductase cytochrome b subunit [Thermoleophilaceae bacterium]|nr:ubiquinol-cytochrome c reductase cytochrome b subunit [Thermoleophilaceae bacterium]
MIRRAVRFVDERYGAAPFLRKALQYVFPDHWSFMLGEIALYCFVILVATGIYLTFFFSPSHETVTYMGQYAPLYGTQMSKAYESVLHISFDVRAGLLIRQTHHWAANVFTAAIVIHVIRVFFTGAFRKPRDLNWIIGVTMLLLVLPEGYLGYSLADDLLSGMGLAIGYSVAMSVPLVGGNLAFLLWGGEYPGATDVFWPRIFTAHVLIIPVIIGGLLALHVFSITRQHHTQFADPGRTERNVVGTPAWPGYALRSLALLSATAGVLFLLGGLIQINPVWQWGPYEPWLSTNAAQPDWYLGWLIGALRLMLPFEPHTSGFTFVPNPFWGGALFPMTVFGVLYLWPWFERRVTRDTLPHHLLDRPRDNPWRTAVGAAFLTWVVIVFYAGTVDRVYFGLGVPYEGQIWFWRFGALVLPVLVYKLTRRVCEELKASDAHPLRGFSGTAVRRKPGGGYETLE